LVVLLIIQSGIPNFPIRPFWNDREHFGGTVFYAEWVRTKLGLKKTPTVLTP